MLLGAFERLPDGQDDRAFEGLLYIDSTVRKPPWYAAILESIAERRPKSYWIPYHLGTYQAQGNNEQDIRKALVFFDRAMANIQNAKRDPDVQRAWVDYGRAQAYWHLVVYGAPEDRKGNAEQAASLLEDLAKRVTGASNAKPNGVQPALADIYNLLGSVYYDGLFRYKTAYETFKQVVALKSDNVDYRTGFAEACLGAEDFEEARGQAGRLLADLPDSQALTADEQLAMRFVVIASLILQGHTNEARKELDGLVAYYNGVPDQDKSGWSYKGTRHFLEERAMPEDQRQLLRNLLLVLEQPRPDITIEQITARSSP